MSDENENPPDVPSPHARTLTPRGGAKSEGTKSIELIEAQSAGISKSNEATQVVQNISKSLKQQVKTKTGEMLQTDILTKTDGARIWTYKDGQYETLSYEKMIYQTDQSHKVPLCESTGSFATEQEVSAIDEFGVGVSLYFKLLKSMVSFFFFCAVLSSPILYIYSCGTVSQDSTAMFDKFLTMFTLGNLGESGAKCIQANIKIQDSITLHCPSGSTLSSIDDLGLEKVGKESVCPDGPNSTQISLALDANC